MEVEQLIIKSINHMTLVLPNNFKRCITIDSFQFNKKCHITNIDKIALMCSDTQIAQYPMSIVSSCSKIIETNEHYFIRFNNDLLSRVGRLYLSHAPISIVIQYISGYQPEYEVVALISQYKQDTPVCHSDILHIQTVNIPSDGVEALHIDFETNGFFMETCSLPEKIEIQLNGHTYIELKKWQYKQIGQYICKEPGKKIIWIPFAYDREWNDKKWMTEPTGVQLLRIDRTTFRVQGCDNLKLHFLTTQQYIFY